jgi:hypothetical protein
MPLATALRVLAAYAQHAAPEIADIEFLKRHALWSEVDLPPDELASEIIRRESAKRKPPRKF